MRKLTLLLLSVLLVCLASLAAAELKEAPMLAELVAAGTLPPVEERMPVEADILVVEPEDEIGQYGGALQLAWKGSNDRWWAGKMTEEPLFRFKPDGSGVEPNVAKGYDVNEDATVFTIYLREGMRWSDGMPFTAKDVLFYWDHLLTKETFGKSIYECYYSIDPDTGEKALASFELVDDYTFRVTHKYPSAQFLERVAIDNKWLFAPAHFHEKVLAEFIGEEEALNVAAEWGFNDIASLGKYTGYYYWTFQQIPTLRAWVASNDHEAQKFVMMRNPYYFKTDTAGNQLPYLDQLDFNKIQDDSHIELGVLSGDVDMAVFGVDKFTILKENEQKGGYRVLNYGSTDWTSFSIQLNQTVKDDNLRALFRDIRFREALSIAVDREEFVNLVYDGLVDPIQISIPEGLVNYQEGWAQRWAQYDPQKAADLLDEIGLPWDAAKEYRNNPDGSELTLTIHYGSNTLNDMGTELLKKYFNEVGLNVNLKVLDGALWNEMKYNNELEIAVETIACFNVTLRPETVVPVRVLTPWQGHYGEWVATGGASGVEPEGDVVKILDAWKLVSSARTQEELDRLGDEIIKVFAENNWVIGYAGPAPKLAVFDARLINVPEHVIYADEFRDLGHARPFQFSFK